METGTGAILLVIGVVALFAAIVGGGVKIKEIEVGNLPSRWRQGMLAIFGIVVGLTGLVMVSGILDSGSGNSGGAAQNVATGDNNAPAPDAENASTATDQSVATAPPDENSGADSTDNGPEAANGA